VYIPTIPFTGYSDRKMKSRLRNSHLILLTNQFPYGIGESFLENEIQYLAETFDTVLVLSKDLNSENIRFNGSHFFPYRMSAKSSFAELLISPLLFLKHLSKSISFISEEVRHAKQRNIKLTFSRLRKMTHDLFKALVISRHIKQVIHTHQLSGRIVLYSYWLNPSALATLFVDCSSNEVKRIARAHRIDLYEEEYPGNYLPFRSVLASGLNRIYTISSHGHKYLTNLVGQHLTSGIKISRLGTPPPVHVERRESKERHLIVSCSFLRETKRVHLIVEALAHINAVEVHWIHFGDGPLRSSLEKLADNTLGPKNNIKYTFRGAIQNRDLHAFYLENSVTLFINTSSSEGIPVTIMEAMSYGIPVIAPDVGGVAEIVSKANGILFPKDLPAQRISSLIEEILNASPDKYQALRDNAYNTWNTQYNAHRNFSTFTADLLNL
jgi:Glycosyltransferase